MPEKKDDFSDFTTYVKLSDKFSLKYHIDYKDSVDNQIPVWIRYRSKKGATVKIEFISSEQRDFSITQKITKANEWIWINPVKIKMKAKNGGELDIHLLGGDIHIDKVNVAVQKPDF